MVDNKMNIKYSKNMNKTLKVKLATTQEQSKALLSTMEQFNEACNWISQKSFEAEVFCQVELHHTPSDVSTARFLWNPIRVDHWGGYHGRKSRP